MDYEKILIWDGKSYINVPKWFQFFSALGSYLFKNRGTKTNVTHIAVSLPGTSVVQVAIAAGISNVIFNRRLYSKTHANRITSLPKGQMIYFIKNDKRVVYSFEGISPQHPVFKEERCAVLKTKDVREYVPERHWSRLQIAMETNTYKRNKRVEGFGIQSPLLEGIYGKEKLLKATSEYSTEFYIIGNQLKINEMAEEIKLKIKNIEGCLNELLCIKTSFRHSYFHSEMISNVGKLPNDFELEAGLPVVFTDSSSYLNHYHHFETHPSIIILNRNDSNDRNEEVVIDLKRRIIQKDTVKMTEEVVKELKEDGYFPPSGIELMIWREK
ncbi:hypothetical protein QNK12_15135 [Neobacillus cucumis]|nr:hypothetical protein QNK12_15135 [Neobacillus cucumis]